MTNLIGKIDLLKYEWYTNYYYILVRKAMDRESSLINLSSRFTKLQKIGDGMNKVYSAIDLCDNNSKVVLKIFPINNSTQYKLFSMEYKILKSLDHPNICKLESTVLITSGEEKFGVFVFKKLEMDLLTYLLSSKKISEDELKYIFRNICEGLAHCHQNRIAHFDLKPENVLLQFKVKNGKKIIHKVKICDFGFAKKWKESSLNSMVKSECLIFGTKEYRPPELHSGTVKVSLEKIDIWSLGVMLFSAFTGYFPYVFDNCGRISSSLDLKMLVNICGNDASYKLVLKLLDKNFRERPDIYEVLNDPWFSN